MRNKLEQKLNELERKLDDGLNELKKLKAKLANESVGDALDNVVEVKGVKFLATKVSDVDMNGLRNLGDQLKEKMGGGVVVIVSTTNDKANVIVMADNDAISKGAHAGNMIKKIAAACGGGGGGKADMAQAGAKDPSKISDAFKVAEELLS